MKKRCKHEIGWCLDKNTNIFIFEDEKVAFNFMRRSRRSYPLRFVCNRIDCGAVRNIYLKAKVVKYGKIRRRWNDKS